MRRERQRYVFVCSNSGGELGREYVEVELGFDHSTRLQSAFIDWIKEFPVERGDTYTINEADGQED